MDINKFDKMTKMNLVAFINMNSDEENQVTLRPRKSTLVRIAKKIAVSQSTKAGCDGWYEKHDSDIPVLNEMAKQPYDINTGWLEQIEEVTKVKPKNTADSIGWIMFYGILLFLLFLMGTGILGRILGWIG